jgi:cyclopropane-fatty-acyl-phospholipid synthase
MEIEEQWEVDGRHYSETARAWRGNLESHKAEVLRVFDSTYGVEAGRWYHRWRLFFLACEELFGYRSGTEWMVGHYRFAPRRRG